MRYMHWVHQATTLFSLDSRCMFNFTNPNARGSTTGPCCFNCTHHRLLPQLHPPTSSRTQPHPRLQPVRRCTGSDIRVRITPMRAMHHHRPLVHYSCNGIARACHTPVACSPPVAKAVPATAWSCCTLACIAVARVPLPSGAQTYVNVFRTEAHTRYAGRHPTSTSFTRET